MILGPVNSLKNFFTKPFTSLFFHGTIQLSTDTDLENKMKIVYITEGATNPQRKI